MIRRTGLGMAGSGLAALSVCLLLATGCGKKEEAENPPPSGPPGGANIPRGPGGPGGPGKTVAENATGSEIYQAKCQNCHGAGGKGGKAPVLTGGAGKSEDELSKIIHDGKGKMPSFAGQLSDDQIKRVAATVVQFQ